MDSKVLNDRFRLVELIGTGGMATVYRGHDLLLDRPVAVKMLREPYASDEGFRERFLEEARAAGKLEHPNIVHIYDVGLDDHQPYFVMEMVKGDDLKALIRRRAPLPIEESLDLARRICAGVGHAHRAGLVHCDLKPHNILLTPEGEVKVADFGIARAFQEEPSEKEVEAEPVIWGSPHYISPEQAAGERPTPASDVYSIGVILYELLTGVPPFHDEDTTALLIKHLQETPPPPSSLNPRVPSQLNHLVSRVLAKQKATRYRNADQFGMAIDEYRRTVEEESLKTRPLSPSGPPAAQRTHPVATSPPEPPRPFLGEEEYVREAPELEGGALPVEEVEEGTDWVLWGLLIVATLLVLGLIPLYYRVYRAYTRTPAEISPAPNMATATPTPVGEYVSVPNLVGLSVADARRLAENYSLGFEVSREEEIEEFLPGTVLEQEPGSGARVEAGTVVKVALASGRAFTLPDLVGYQKNVVLPNLESQGLIIAEDEIWSTEPKGKILAQEPEPETEVRAGDTITLTLSGGTERTLPLQVNLNNLIILEEAIVPQRPFKPGDTLSVALRWRALRTVDRAYIVFTHLLTPNMLTLIAQDDSEPANGTNPTDTWRPGEIIIDPHQLTLPPDTPPGTYQIRVGMYTEAGRLQVIDSGETQVVDNSIFIAEIEVRP
ncbi:MAG: protein kinase domain-containing protein [Anaerolineales bacterium]